jgi:hypothetical protein
LPAIKEGFGKTPQIAPLAPRGYGDAERHSTVIAGRFRAALILQFTFAPLSA